MFRSLFIKAGLLFLSVKMSLAVLKTFLISSLRMDTMEKIEAKNSRLEKIAGRVNWPVVISGIASLILKFSTGTLLPTGKLFLKV